MRDEKVAPSALIGLTTNDASPLDGRSDATSYSIHVPIAAEASTLDTGVPVTAGRLPHVNPSSVHASDVDDTTGEFAVGLVT